MLIETTYHPRKEAIEAVYQGLSEFNQGHFTDLNERPLALLVIPSRGEVKGGLVARLHYDTMHIQRLWIDESLRGKGLGSRLLTMAEKEARKQGIRRLYLDTYSFQAPEFYLRHGFLETGRYRDFPLSGTDKIFLQKTLKQS